MADGGRRVDWTGLPAGPLSDQNLRQSLATIDEFLRQRWGARGNPLLRSPSWDEISSSGLATVEAGAGGVIASPGDSPFDLIPPGAPTGLSATAGTLTVVLQWTAAGDYETEVWRSATDVIGTAVRIGSTRAELFADAVGDVGTAQYYWVKHISAGGVPGPFNAISGTVATPGAVDTAVIANAAIVTAKIADLAVTTGKIVNLAVTNAKIADLAVGKLTAGSIATGQYIQSSNYSAGTVGFRINADGTAEFSNITARGNILASSVAASIAISSPTITSGSISASSITGGTIYGTTIDTATMVAGVVRSSSTMAVYYTPSGSRIALVGGFFGGYAQWWDLTATGTNLALQVNGKFRLYADGRLEIDEAIIRNNNVLASGSGSISSISWTPAAVYDPGGSGSP